VTTNGHGRFNVMRTAGTAPGVPSFSILPVGSGKALATGMSKANADDVVSALGMAVGATDADRIGAEAIREHLDASGRVEVGQINGLDRAAFMVTMADGHRFTVRVRGVDLVDPPRLLPPVPANTWGAWEVVGPDLRRVRVPSGWLYQTGSANGPPTSPVFVPGSET